MMKNFKTLIVLIVVNFNLLAQSTFVEISAAEYLDAIISLEDKLPNNADYILKTSTKIYPTYESQIPVAEQKINVICQGGKVYNIYTSELFIVQEELLNVSIDSINQHVIIANTAEAFNYKKQSDDLKHLTELGKKFYKRSDKSQTTLSIEFLPGYDLKGIEIELINNVITRVTYYSSQSYDHYTYPNELARFVMEINDLTIAQKPSNINKMVQVTDVIQISDKQVVLTEKYKNFELIDLR